MIAASNRSPAARLTRILLALACLALLAALAALAQAEVTQEGAVRLSVDGKLSPRSLPRRRRAPIAVSLDWKIATTDGSAVPKLRRVRIEINRNGRFDSTGLPVCDIAKLQSASTASALAACRPSLLGKGSFTARVALRGQIPYDARGRLVVFNGKSHGRSVLLGQIYSPHPFPTSLVVTFALGKLAHGAYGTALDATLPKAPAAWDLTGIKMTLSRRYSYGGHRHSFLSAGCPAPKGFQGAFFPLARTSFAIAGGKRLTSTLMSNCRARG